MAKLPCLVTLLSQVVLIAALDGRYLHGVPSADHIWYTKAFEDKVFRCRDGSKSVKLEQVNDEYCDCPDGSDEPGTAACTNGIGFWCANTGHEGHSIPSSRVGDGICDCCDGSDEAASSWGLYVTGPEWRKSKNKCADTCATLARAAAAIKAERKAKVEQARAIRQEKIQIGLEGKKRREEMLASLPGKVDEKQREIDTLEGKKTEEEQREESQREAKKVEAATSFQQGLDSHQLSDAEAIKVAVEYAFSKSEESTEALTDFVKQTMGPDFDVDETEALSLALPATEPLPSTTVLEEARKALQDAKDAQVQQAKDRSWVSRLFSGTAPAEEQTKLEAAVTAAEAAETVEKAKMEGDRRVNLAGVLGLEKIASGTLIPLVLKAAQKTKQSLKLLEIIGDVKGQPVDINSMANPDEPPVYSSPEAEQAREAVRTAQSQKEMLEKELQTYRDEAGMDFGVEQEFYYMKGNCYHTTITEHTYRVCPFAESKQGTRGIGQWKGWHKQSEWHSQYRMMKWDNGDRFGCPDARELTMHIQCGSTENVVKIDENQICKYEGLFETPAACVDD